MSHNYYQQPGWGTDQFQFGPPPMPSFQPQPSWGGLDYYRAHAPSPNPSLFDHAWNRVRDHSAIPNGVGVGRHEAKHWHRRAYAGIGEISQMLPAEIGHAAAYEAYRTWKHNRSLYEPLSGDPERQREGLIGLAVAEATRLLQYSNRPMDHYNRMAAAETAAHTISNIFFARQSRSRSRHGSFGSYNDGYGDYPRRSRSRSRSRLRHPPPVTGPTAGYSPIPIPSAPSSMYDGPITSYGSYGSYGGGGGGRGIPMQMQGYPSSVPMQSTPSYLQNSVPMVAPMNSQHHGSSMTYPTTPYPGMPMGGGGMMSSGLPPSQTIVVTRPHRKHKRHHHHKRSRSIDPHYIRF